ncbi:hypothetical protein [Acidaminobacter hydrogenoformans]|uniref:Activator of Hsp90 ATPase homolog 1-like protein n=1 Tax=Acidaminobacter hydrogenoformans DSM 2784 TaxID=1120920 RepID=A0A1G5S374_9FIRM|nr:hypothetical protein [Acidaminobacter hydrogenoformans]SCZ80201.1 hypothetical protein SAMN03080599_02148 [Acidaminobacter hydrogenoformans DSM 2784]
MKTLEFKITLSTPVSLVWETMLSPTTYRQWTSAFMMLRENTRDFSHGMNPT